VASGDQVVDPEAEEGRMGVGGEVGEHRSEGQGATGVGDAPDSYTVCSSRATELEAPFWVRTDPACRASRSCPPEGGTDPRARNTAPSRILLFIGPRGPEGDWQNWGFTAWPLGCTS
jgi:hypothetical protein